MKLKLSERRRYLRVEVPLKVSVEGDIWDREIYTKNISPIGLRLENSRKPNVFEEINVSIFLPDSKEPVRLRGKVVWEEKTSIEDNAPYDVGVEILYIEESSKSVLSKYLCDLLYSASYEEKRVEE